MPVTCPGKNRERRVAHKVLHREILHAQDFFSWRPYAAGVACASIELIGQRSAHHVADDRFARERFGVGGDDAGAVSENGDPIGDFERFLQRMADEDDGYALLAQPVHQREEMMLFLRGQTGGRLVEDDHFRLETNRPRDFDHLPLGRAEREHNRRRVHGKVSD
jgi:hypothetical protein